ncbi:MAG: hypothetical protein OXE05_07150 [Chloroflexi bacterium]|nr:hypothetical protein [Chloroflexota bacterium]
MAKIASGLRRNDGLGGLRRNDGCGGWRQLPEIREKTDGFTAWRTDLC